MLERSQLCIKDLILYFIEQLQNVSHFSSIKTQLFGDKVVTLKIHTLVSLGYDILLGVYTHVPHLMEGHFCRHLV